MTSSPPLCTGIALSYGAVMNQSIRSRSRHAFTLVELLVVIGIIAILISVLLPVLASARRAGYKTKCLASLHQIGDGFKMYAAENSGYWPICADFYTDAA